MSRTTPPKKAKAPPNPTATPTPANDVPKVAPKQFVGILNPQFGMNLETLVACVMCFRFNTPIFIGADPAGNLVDANGQVVIPANLTRQFQAIEVSPTQPAQE